MTDFTTDWECRVADHWRHIDAFEEAAFTDTLARLLDERPADRPIASFERVGLPELSLTDVGLLDQHVREVFRDDGGQVAIQPQQGRIARPRRAQFDELDGLFQVGDRLQMFVVLVGDPCGSAVRARLAHAAAQGLVDDGIEIHGTSAHADVAGAT